MLIRLAAAVGFLFSAAAGANAMDFALRDHLTVHASGAIVKGDAAKFAALPKFDTLELDSPGGLVAEALAMASNMDARGGIRTVVRPGASCASACAMAVFISGQTRVVWMGGRLGIHSCARGRIPVPECNAEMAENATAHGVPWGVIGSFGDYTKPSSMLWFGAEDAECWGLMKWNSQDESNSGFACFQWALFTSQNRTPHEVTAENANDLLCRMNAGTSRTYVSTGLRGQGFSDVYRSACERVAADPQTPKYAAVDILMWLTLTDPNIVELKPGTLMARILEMENGQLSNCWKCLTIIALSESMHGYFQEAVGDLKRAAALVERDTGSVPAWLSDRIDVIGAEAAKRRSP